MEGSKSNLFCPSCGAELPDSPNYCVACGFPLLPEEEEADALIGATIADNFRLDNVLGEGAMGRVYKATQLSLEKTVAIKVLHQHLAGDRNIVRRFHREARAASRLNHPNSLHIIDFGQTQDRVLYIAMEYIEGRDLHQVISEDFPLALDRIVDLIGQVCDALDEAHAAGIVHRDLKAENIMVVRRRDGREEVKVCDFGIAKIQDPGDNDASAPITVAGIVCGTPEYMSPEQCRGEELDGRADVYSLGVLLYQITTKALPFVADSPLGVVTRQLTDQPVRPTQIRSDVEETKLLENVILKALTKDRDQRYASALELKSDLERVLNGETIPEPPSMGVTPIELVVPRRRRRSRWPLVVALSVFSVVAVASIAVVATLALDSGDETTASSLPPDDVSAQAGLSAPVAPTQEDSGPAAVPLPVADAAVVDGGTGSTADDADLSVGDEPTAVSDVTKGQPRQHTRRTVPEKHQTAPTTPTPPPEEPTPQKSAFQLGREAYLGGNCAEALTHFERARQSSPGNAEVHRMLGKCYMRVGRTAQGREAYRRYLELRPNASDRAFIERIIGD